MFSKNVSYALRLHLFDQKQLSINYLNTDNIYLFNYNLFIIFRRKVVTTDASNKGWGALCEGKPTFGLWSEEESGLHINCLEMLAVCQACQFFLSDIRGHHVLICSDSRSVLSYINHQGGLVSKRLCTQVNKLLVWAQNNLGSLKAMHVPGKMNLNVSSEKWTLHLLAVQIIWEVFGSSSSPLVE